MNATTLSPEAKNDGRTIFWPDQDWQPGIDKIYERAYHTLIKGGKAIVTPTKVGYIVMTIDGPGLKKKFSLKERPESKPGVVLLSSLEQLEMLAELNPEISALYKNCWEQNILLGCILPWQKDASNEFIPNDGARELVQDKRGTSCFVVKYGRISEEIARILWEKERKVAFASSANPSGQGNRGCLAGVGERILDGADFLIQADKHVREHQPDKTDGTRYAQGVMVSFVNNIGNLSLNPPVIIRKGLAVGRVSEELTKIFNHFDYRHGTYH